MDFATIKEWLTLENIMELVEQYRSFGPIPGVLLPMLEAFFPFLPLVLFVMANVNAFGLWWGFLFSWAGACLGSLAVFMLIRKYGQRRMLRVLQRHPKIRKSMDWIDRHGFGPLFLLLCFPFTPSAIVNVVAGLSKISKAQYMLAVMSGKTVMIFTIGFVGYDIRALITNPIRTAIVAAVIIALWYIGKRIEARMNRRPEKDHNVG